MKWRFVTVVALLGCTALLLRVRNSAEIIPAHQPLQSFPQTFAGWSSTDLPISKDVLDVLGPGDFLTRQYQYGSPAPSVGLFIAYFQPTFRRHDSLSQELLAGRGLGAFAIGPGHPQSGGTSSVPGEQVSDC